MKMKSEISSKFKKLPAGKEEAIEKEIKMMLHAHRDCLRNQNVDTSKVRFDCREGYYGEAFGIMRTLQVLGYGKLGCVNICNEHYPKWNLSWWFDQLQDEVLKEENFGGNKQCDYCCKQYGKDDAGRTRKPAWTPLPSLQIGGGPVEEWEFLTSSGWKPLPCDEDSEQMWEDLGGATMTADQALEQERSS